jgi:uncharacterized protein (DUF58 family)
LFDDPARIQGVRDYQPGDSLRRMDWKTSARAGSLQVRRYEPSIALETAVLLNLLRSDYADVNWRQPSELGVIFAASIAVRLIQDRQAVGLATNGHDPLAEGTNASRSLPSRKGNAHLMTLLDLLARIEIEMEEERSLAFLDLLRQGSMGLPWGSSVVVITPREQEGLLSALLTLRRRGLAVMLVMLDPGPEFVRTSERAEHIGIQAHRVASRQDLDQWR